MARLECTSQSVGDTAVCQNQVTSVGRSHRQSVTDRAKEDGGGVCRSPEREIEVRDRERGGREASARQESGISGLVCIASQFRSAMRLGGMLHLARAVLFIV